MRHQLVKPFILIITAVFLLSGCSLISTAIEPQPVLQSTAVPADAIASVTQNDPAPTPAPTVAPSVMADLRAQEQAFVSIYEQVNPAVVNISVGAGQGSGFVYDETGHIITNNHVVAGGGEIIVTFFNGVELNARVVGTDPDSDLAVIRVTETPDWLTAVPLTDSDTLRVGQIVVAIGNPFGLESSMTTGIISGLGRLLPSTQNFNGTRYNIPDIIQTDAAINPGNSGGPLLDLEGNVIGVNAAIESPVRGSSGIGYAIPANLVSVVAPQLIENGRVQHPWLGIAGTELNSEVATSIGLAPDRKGILVGSITAGSPADTADLRAINPGTNRGGDVIVGIEGRPVQDFDDLLGYLIQYTRVGQTITLEVLRDGQIVTIPVTLQPRPTAG